MRKMKKLQNKIKCLSLLPILMTMILMSCSDKDNEDIIYYPYGTIGVNGVIYTIEEDHAAVLTTSNKVQRDSLGIVPQIKKDGKQYPVTVIKAKAFYQSPVKKLTIPASIEKIEEDF